MSNLTTDDYIAQMLDWCKGHEHRFFQIDFYPGQPDESVVSVTAYTEPEHPSAQGLYPYAITEDASTAPEALEGLLKVLVPEDD